MSNTNPELSYDMIWYPTKPFQTLTKLENTTFSTLKILHVPTIWGRHAPSTPSTPIPMHAHTAQFPRNLSIPSRYPDCEQGQPGRNRGKKGEKRHEKNTPKAENGQNKTVTGRLKQQENSAARTVTKNPPTHTYNIPTIDMFRSTGFVPFPLPAHQGRGNVCTIYNRYARSYRCDISQSTPYPSAWHW